MAPRAELEALAAYAPADLRPDVYGSGAYLEAFEARVAAELGKDAAAFMPTGTMAQGIALRIWCERAANRTIAFHPTSHLQLHESSAYAMVHALQALHVGSPVRLMTPADVSAVRDRVAVLLVELPQREIGAQLPPWHELLELCGAARERGMRLHLDGARLWEAAPFYGRSHAAIAALFDSVYVSFYKGLGGLAGAMLAGDSGFIEEARVWQHRMGGRPVTLYPFALAAQRGFEERLPLMRVWYERARALAPKLAAIEGVAAIPNPSQTNTFHLHLRGDRETLEARALALAEARGIWSFARLAPTVDPLVQKWEFVVASATMALDDGEIVATLRAIVNG